ncbi:MAG: DNRLRE domain-containing protein [Lentisphaerae bacterium]|nr:MAG: DNRLRE domain-containing protein [Lentisphaerota bacterium]
MAIVFEKRMGRMRILKCFLLLVLLFYWEQGTADEARTARKKHGGDIRGEDDPLQKVEADQSSAVVSSGDIFNRNIALNSMCSYTHATIYQRGAFARRAHDGSYKTYWGIPHGVESAALEISWGLATIIDRIDIYELDSHIRSYRLEIDDGKGWRLVEAGGKIGPHCVISFAPCLASALRLSVTTDGKGGKIAEVEVYNSRSSASLPRYGSRRLIDAMRKAGTAVILYDGSPFGFSRFGRELIAPRERGCCLSNRWGRSVIRYICSRLGIDTVETGHGGVKLRLGTNVSRMEFDSSRDIIDQLRALSRDVGLAFYLRDSLLIIGRSIGPLTDRDVSEELRRLLGHDPALNHWVAQGKRWDGVITPFPQETGKTFEWTGFRVSIVPGTNVPAWLKYVGTHSIRTWAGAPRIMKRYVKVPQDIRDRNDFERYKQQLRARPEQSGLVDFEGFRKKWQSSLSFEFGTCNKLGITVLNETGPKDWDDRSWAANFHEWAATYALTYYLAKYYGVSAHQFGNEPDRYLERCSDRRIAFRLMFIADAVHSAIADVNRDCNRKLESIYTAPVLASDYVGRIARVMMRNLRIRYDGRRSDTDLVQLFDRHRYSDRPHQNALEVRRVKKMMQAEAGRTIGQVFTELNFSTAGNWRRPHITFTNDTANVFTSVAAILGAMMECGGVYGVFVFKVCTLREDDTPVFFSNTMTCSCYRERDPGVPRTKTTEISYTSKNLEACRLFAGSFYGSRPLFKTRIECSDRQYQAHTTFDAENDCYYVWSVQGNDWQSYDLIFDFSKLDVEVGALVTVEAVTSARHGEIVAQIELPSDRRVRLRQPAKSVILLKVLRRKTRKIIIPATADATVGQGQNAEVNRGRRKWLGVRRHSNPSLNEISFIRFKLPRMKAQVRHASLQLFGYSINSHAYDGGFLFRIYTLAENNWHEDSITGMNAPNLYRTVSSAVNVDLQHYPVGHLTCFREPRVLAVDVTRVIREAIQRSQTEVSFMLIREMHWKDENTDSMYARIASRETDDPDHIPSLRIDTSQ